MQQRKVRNPELPKEFPDDNWIAVGDRQNEWLTLAKFGNRYCKTHTEVAGSTPSWGQDNNPANWRRLAKCCDGPATLLGRYIRLEYNHPECLNLAQIQVYSNDRTDSNLITSNTNVTKSSGYEGDIFPSRNFVDGRSFVHTSCYDVPWIEVDMGSSVNIYRIFIINRKDCCQSRVLGTTLKILNDQRQIIYTSYPVTETSNTYTWFPPSPNIYNDYTQSTPPSKPYNGLGCWRDTGDRAIQQMDGSDPTISDPYQGRTDAINKCAKVAENRGFKYFGVQDGGWCAASNDLSRAKRYGPSNSCRIGGKGGGWANNIYQFTD